jgi:hypothetical protein
LTLALRTGRRERIWCRLELEQYNCCNLVYDTLDNATIFPILISVHQYCLSGAEIDTSTFVMHMHRAGYPLLIRTVPSESCQREEENLVNNKFPSDHEAQSRRHSWVGSKLQLPYICSVCSVCIFGEFAGGYHYSYGS